MKINKFCLQHKSAFIPKEINLDFAVNIFQSEENSLGKTTLMRALLYSLGFSIPNTELIKFEDFEFQVDISCQTKLFEIKRHGDLLIINGQEFDLPIDQRSAHMFLFGNSNAEILSNILGVIYFDQEKGWTLLNRGTIIGTNRFNIESFFRGLKGDESDESYQLVEKIAALNKKIAQYNLMLNVAEYQTTMNQVVGQKLDYESYQQDLDLSLLEKRIRMQNIEDEISRISNTIKTNKDFSDYIEMKNVYVKNPSGGDPIRVTKNTLFEYSSVEDVNFARKSILLAERNTIKRQIAEIEISQRKQITLMNLPTADEELTSRLSSIRGISAIEVKTLLNKFHAEKTRLSVELNDRTKTNNTWISEAYKIIIGYAKELEIPFDYKIDIFTSNLKAKSGTILHEMVFIYKLAYIKLVSIKLGYPVPIFCDSPSGREVKKDTVNKMINLLARDFSDHQIFIASLFKYEETIKKSNIIILDGTLFNEATLLD